VQAFTEKRPLDYEGVHARFGSPAGAFAWGTPSATCASCGAKDLPEEFQHCGNCGASLTS
jgi:hypothetical protein